MDECRKAGERLTPYVDDALPAGERAEVDRHLTACPPCRAAAAEEQGGRAVLRSGAERLRDAPVPPGLRSRCEALARERARVSRVAARRARLVPATMIAALVIFVGLAVLSVATRRSNALLAAQLTADHVKCFKVFVPEPVDAQTVEEHLRDDYGWTMHVPPSSDEEGLSLLGGRRCLYADGTVPHVMYRAESGQHVSLFRLDGVTRTGAEVTALGHRSQIWSRDGNTYVLVAPAGGSADLSRIARYVRAEAR